MEAGRLNRENCFLEIRGLIVGGITGREGYGRILDLGRR